jgi:predicted nucleic acid-binding protein
VPGTPPRAPCVCKDPDDQVFIDLAVAHGALLLSKDQAVLTMRKRLALRKAWWCRPCSRVLAG